MRPITTPVIDGRVSTPLTGKPSIANRSAIAVASAGKSTKSRSQASGTRITVVYASTEVVRESWGRC